MIGYPSAEPHPTGPLAKLRDLALSKVRCGLIEQCPPLPGAGFDYPEELKTAPRCVFMYT
jgi:hypothetical protein